MRLDRYDAPLKSDKIHLVLENNFFVMLLIKVGIEKIVYFNRYLLSNGTKLLEIIHGIANARPMLTTTG